MDSHKEFPWEDGRVVFEMETRICASRGSRCVGKTVISLEALNSVINAGTAGVRWSVVVVERGLRLFGWF